MSKVLVVGGGAAGMFAAIAAAKNGNEVHLYEKNEKLGKKVYITGKGRCNITNACDRDTLFASVLRNSKFLYSSFSAFDNQDAIDFFEQAGVPTKVERGGRVFPVSDHSSDVIAGLTWELNSLGVTVHLRSRVRNVVGKEHFSHLETADGRKIYADACIIATGGLSYQSTGSDGDGYRFAKNLGHTVTPLSPSLVPMNVREEDVKDLQGLSLRNVKATIREGEKVLYEDFGEMLFTHYGVSGPLILSASGYVGEMLQKKPLVLDIDLKAALTDEQLDQRILRDFQDNQNRQFKNALGKLFPSKLIPVMIKRSQIDPEKKVHLITKEERMQFAKRIRHFTFTLTGLRDYNEAIITRGGVCTREINPRTMESKLVQGLYFAGEVLDLDALTGGFNLQIAWSSAYAAGSSIY